MRKGTYLFFGLVFSLILMGSQVKPQTDQLLWETVSRLGIKVDRMVYHHGSRLSHRILTSQLDQLVGQIANELKLSSIQKQTDADGMRYQAKGKRKNLTTILTVVNDQPSQIWSTPYISIQMIQHGEQRERFIYQRLAEILSNYELTPKIDYSMQGRKSYQNEPLEQLITQTFKQLHAYEVESVRTKQVVSISAWSPRISGSLQTRGGRMNIQAATKVDEQRNQLLFTIGSPIITIEY